MVLDAHHQPHGSPRLSPEPPVAIMRELYDAGFALVPLGGGSDGKAPLVKFTTRARLPFAVVLEKMRQVGSATYGIRTDGLAVVDMDEDTDELRAVAFDRFGRSSFAVATPRGRHLYFRHRKQARLPNLRAEGYAIDVKGGARSFVVGPGSVRPDGGSYDALDVLPTFDSLTPFRDARPPDATSGTNVKKPASAPLLVAEGERTTSFLLPKVLEYVWTAESERGLVEELRAAVDWDCVRPETITDAEVEKWGAWAWRLRCENSIWTKGSEVVQLTWNEFLTLAPMKQGSDALVLLGVLRQNHLGRDRNGKPLA